MIGSVYASFLQSEVMLADFQANGRWPKEDRLNMADSEEARTTEVDLRTWELVPSRRIAEAVKVGQNFLSLVK